MEDPDELVSVYEGANLTEAHFVKNLLFEQGIDAAVSEENVPLAGLPITPPDVLVRRRDLAQAQAVVTAYNEDQIEQYERPNWKCSNCGETVEGAYEECYNCGTAKPAATA